VAPLRFAAGVQNKVLQAMDAGVPTVITPLVREGLEQVSPDVLRVGATAEEIASHVIDLIRNPEEAALLGARGRDWVRGRFTWDHAVRAFENLAGPIRREQAIQA
jgi:glycosyltransferase involved in cell wall biosynthesis